MAPKFALFTKGSKLPLNQAFLNRFLVTTVSRQALEMFLQNLVDSSLKSRLTLSHLQTVSDAYATLTAFENILTKGAIAQKL